MGVSLTTEDSNGASYIGHYENISSGHLNHPHIGSMDEYFRMHAESINDPLKFWGAQAQELITWSSDFDVVQHGTLEEGNISWFIGGKLNACVNCVDRHAFKNPDKDAIIHETDNGNNPRSLTYGELLKQVSKVAWVLRDLGVRKGDVVSIYMPMVPEALVAILACARIGAVHSVIFAGFSSGSIRDRVTDSKSKLIITSDASYRGGKIIGLKTIVDEALADVDLKVLVFKAADADIPWTEGRDYWWHEEVSKWPSYCPAEPMDSEDPLFLLYTSGSTGKPKGIVHTTGGYLVGAASTGKYVFDIHDNDRYFCGGDVGWITGHTYVVYAPLLLGISTLVFEGTPAFPTHSRYWNIIEKHRISHFYVAPTALRLLKRAGSSPSSFKMKHLRVLGSVGEPIAPNVWKWYHEEVGKSRCHVVDTYWQTETGSHVITPLAGVTPTKPGAACFPFFGIDAAIIDPVTGEDIHEPNVDGVLVFKSSWPSMARSILGDHQRFQDTYLSVYKGYYFTGDSASRDEDGYFWIKGRVDDVINVSGHRLTTAEIEASLIAHPAVAESAVVGVSDEITGQAVVAFVSLKQPTEAMTGDSCLTNALRLHIRKSIGSFAAPKSIYIVADLPKTRSGKIIRRILRKVVMGEGSQLGDVSTLSDPTVVDAIIKLIEQK